MPSKNVIKIDTPETYYHIYAWGASKQTIFLTEADYAKFLSLFARYLSKESQTSKTGVVYPHYRADVELVAYCLMGNHFHFAVYQREQGGMSRFMKAVMTSYAAYFNRKYKRSGSLYESTYKASRISSDSYLLHISRYIHLNPRYWKRYPYSSLAYYLGRQSPEWLSIEKLRQHFPSPQEYLAFLEDYEGQKAILEEIKYELADR